LADNRAQIGGDTVRFLLLLHGDPEAEAALGPAGRRAIVDEHARFAGRLAEAGALVLSEALEPPEQGRTVSFEDNAPVITDGPYLETKEALGGVYVIEAPDIDAAVEIARGLPRSPGLVAEIRPIAPM
jgi:hypothetical protein